MVGERGGRHVQPRRAAPALAAISHLPDQEEPDRIAQRMQHGSHLGIPFPDLPRLRATEPARPGTVTVMAEGVVMARRTLPPAFPPTAGSFDAARWRPAVGRRSQAGRGQPGPAWRALSSHQFLQAVPRFCWLSTRLIDPQLRIPTPPA